MYKTLLFDHYQNPRNKGGLNSPDFSSQRANPSCGDIVCFQGKITLEIVTAIAFSGIGCVISQATASLLSEYILNKPISQISSLDKNFIEELIGMQLGPLRLKCALLPLEALQASLLPLLATPLAKTESEK